jgi:N-acetylneuraminate synthase
LTQHFSELRKNRLPFIVAEIGVNYYDIAKAQNILPLDAAFLMIDAAVHAGADAVKFQSYKADKLAVKDSPAYWDINQEPSPTQFELFSQFDSFHVEDYQALSDYCKRTGIMFLSTPFDFEAVDYLDELCPVFKISSSDITNWPFLEYIAKKQKPVFLSTGASTIEEIDGSVGILKTHGNGEICLLHCVLSYPTKYEDANLNMIKHLAEMYPEYLIGYSDHTPPDATMTCLTTAYLYGAKVIEKHFTLNKSLPGNDHYHAMDPADLAFFKSNLELIDRISGETEKRPLQCEEGARVNARRSMVAKSDIKKGETITMEMLTFKRPGTGIAPKYLRMVIGASAKRNITGDTTIKFEDLDLKED